MTSNNYLFTLILQHIFLRKLSKSFNPSLLKSYTCSLAIRELQFKFAKSFAKSTLLLQSHYCLNTVPTFQLDLTMSLMYNNISYKHISTTKISHTILSCLCIIVSNNHNKSQSNANWFVTCFNSCTSFSSKLELW